MKPRRYGLKIWFRASSKSPEIISHPESLGIPEEWRLETVLSECYQSGGAKPENRSPERFLFSARIVCYLLCLAKLFQIFQNKWTVCSNLPQRRAFLHLRAIRAGIQSLFPDAVMYGTELVAEWRFCALHSAAGAVDHFRRDRHPVELRPQFSGFLAQGVVVCKCCDSGVAGFSVQSAAADQLIGVFHNCLHKVEFNVHSYIVSFHQKPIFVLLYVDILYTLQH